MVRQQDDADSDGDSEAGSTSDPGITQRLRGHRGRGGSQDERRWWHVPDEQIERYIRHARGGSGSRGLDPGSPGPSGDMTGTLEPLALRTSVTVRPRPSLQGVTKRTVRFEDEQGDALDFMLQAAEQQRRRLEEQDGSPQDDDGEGSDEDQDPPVDWSSRPPEERPKDWWRVPDERIDKLVRSLSKSSAKLSPVRGKSLGSSATLSATALATLSAAASPVRGQQPAGGAKMGVLTLHILVVENGETLSLRVPRSLRAGPGRPPPANPLTDIFGEGASSRGFDATAAYLDCCFRFSSIRRRTQWTSLKASSLKGLIAMATEVEPARQRLCYRGGAVTLDDMSLASYRLRDGELMELHFLPPPSSSPPVKREVVLACTRKRHEVKEKSKNASRKPVSSAGDYGVLRRPDGDVQILPRWNHKGDANVFSKVGIAVDGDGSHRVKPVFEREPIYLADANDPKLSRVREAVVGHSRYIQQ